MLKIRNQRHYLLVIGKNNRYLAALFNHLFMRKSILLPLLFLFVLFSFANSVFAQPAWTINLLDSSKRAKKFEEQKLGSEKMADKKFTRVRHVFQNNYTHFNYYYNANNKIHAVLERARMTQKDDYTRLLPYYPYSLENTATQKTELDSVIYKVTAGILLHDLRNDWIDNMYLLMGQAYFFKKDFDSAAATFQFINYNLFPRKKKEEDNRVVGTKDAASNGGLSIANKEHPNILQKLTAQPPSRNDALIWMIRTLIEQDEFGDAASLINTLEHDANLPHRLVNDLAEVNAYWFFKQNMYDSSAAHLEKALSNAASLEEQARTEYLLAQLYEISHKFNLATTYYNKASRHTVDPLMDIYAQLNNAKMIKGVDSVQQQKSIDDLVHMAKKDRFLPYRDIIFYSAGDLAMQKPDIADSRFYYNYTAADLSTLKPDTNSAVLYYNKSLYYNENNIAFKNKAFLKLADIAYSRKQFKLAFAMYDSLQSGDTSLTDRLPEIQERRNSLSKIVEKIVIIEREDSLQKIAAMPLAARTVFIKQMAKKLRKERGIKEEEVTDDGTGVISFDSKKNEPADLFGGSSTKGEWYFYNASLKSKGLSDFKRKWGTRTNADNWRRKSAAAAVAKNNGVASPPDMSASDIDAAVSKGDGQKQAGDTKNEIKGTEPQDVSFNGLMANIPLTPEKISASNTLIAGSLFDLAKLYQTELEDYRQAVITYDQSLQRFPDSLYNGDIYLGLYFCYTKLGDTEKAAYYKNLVNTKFSGSRSSKLLGNAPETNPAEKSKEGTLRYETIYNLFIEGKFDAALSEKKKADSLYGNNYWSPQLLYIETVYFVKQHEDSIAIDKLGSIISLYPKSPLVPKAERMIDVLQRRDSIERYLTALQITRANEDEVTIFPKDKLVRNDSNLIVSPKLFDSSKAVIPPPLVTVKDSVKKVPALVVNGPYTFNPASSQNVIMVLDKVDATYINESKNAFTRFVSENIRGQIVTVSKTAVDKDLSLVVFTAFENADAALEFLAKVKKAAPDEVSWLPAAKYSFLIISDDNLQLLQINKNLKEYKALLNKQYPGKF
jgi:tetratricopeptide (TPR) repeat protein